MDFAPLSMPTFAWSHSDARGLGAAADAGLARAASRAWGGSRASVAADLRALVLRTAVAAANLSHASIAPGEFDHLVVPDLSTVVWHSPDHQRFGGALLRTVHVLALGGSPSSAALTTRGGSPATPGVTDPNAGVWPYVVGFLGLVGAAAYVVSAIFTAEQTSFVSDRAFRRKDTGDKLMELHASLLKLVELHCDAERSAGMALPFNVAEKTAWAALLQEQDAFVQAITSEKPLPPPKSGGGFFSGVGSGIGLAALGALAYLVAKD